MKIVVNIVAEIEAVSYPLDTLSELLYNLIDDLAQVQKLHNKDVPLPLTKIKKLSDGGSTGKLTANIARAEE